jgi:hypothetical protein
MSLLNKLNKTKQNINKTSFKNDDKSSFVIKTFDDMSEPVKIFQKENSILKIFESQNSTKSPINIKQNEAFTGGAAVRLNRIGYKVMLKRILTYHSAGLERGLGGG